MAKGHEIDEWFPLFITIWLTSPAVRAMTAEQRGWYIDLLVRAWKNAEMPCHLRSDHARLWTQAGAKSRAYFMANCELVLQQFSVVRIEGSEWIVQPDQLQIYTNQLSKHHSYHKRGVKGSEARWKDSLAIENNSSAIAQVKPSYSSAIQTRDLEVISDSPGSSLKESKEFNASECARIVNSSTGIDYVGRNAMDLYRDVIQKEHGVTGVSCMNVAEVMVAARNEYLDIPVIERPFDWPCKAFFEQGIWKQREKWRNDNRKPTRKTDKERNDDAFAESERRERDRAASHSAAPEGND